MDSKRRKMTGERIYFIHLSKKKDYLGKQTEIRTKEGGTGEEKKKQEQMSLTHL